MLGLFIYSPYDYHTGGNTENALQLHLCRLQNIPAQNAIQLGFE